jgi:hypothetical protein
LDRILQVYSSPHHPLNEFVLDLDRSIEQKFVFPSWREDLFADWLDVGAVVDPLFPTAWISSLYFDSPLLELYDQKVGSDYAKSKVRLRWYTLDGETQESDTVGCFLEVKQKIGSVRTKARLPLDVSRAALKNPVNSSEIMAALDHCRSLGYIGTSDLVPAAVIRYRRRRYVDHRDNLRHSIDSNISAHNANPLLFRERDAFLGLGVLEVKGGEFALPALLGPVRGFMHREAFSKYARCCELLVDPVFHRH